MLDASLLSLGAAKKNIDQWKKNCWAFFHIIASKVGASAKFSNKLTVTIKCYKYKI